MESLRRAARSAAAKAASRLPVQWVRPLSGVSLVVPYYHMVSDLYVPHVSPLYRFRSIAEFKSDLEFFLSRFEPVTLTDIVDALNGTRALTRPSFHLTFDDGFREMHDVVAPILQRAGVPATFFLNTAFLDGGGLAHHNELSLLIDRLQSRHSRVGAPVLQRIESVLQPPENRFATLRQRVLAIRYGETSVVRSLAGILDVDFGDYVRTTRPYLCSAQIANLLGRGFTVGGHSHDHPLYADLPLSKQLAQTRMSMDLLDTQFGLNPKAFAFPHTDHGVEKAFFSSVFSEPLLDVSFGTAGFASHFHPRNIERVSIENTSAPASQILARQFARATYSRLRHRGRF